VRTAIRELYDAEVAALDAALGRLFDALGQRGYDESNLFVVVTADHGEALGEQGFIGHMLGMPDAVLHVPLVLTGPGIDPSVVKEPVQLNQLRATIRELLQLPARDGIASPLPPWGLPPRLLIAEHPEPRWYARELTRFNPASGERSLGNWVAAERQGVKSVFDDQGNGVTYELARDPDELDPQPLRVGQALVEAYAVRTAGHRLAGRGTVSEKARWALRQLGYTRE
jgi:arylsulfatase A-like enzyme